MICLCPNHHEQFDDYGYYIEPDSFEIKGLENFEGKKLVFPQTLFFFFITAKFTNPTVISPKVWRVGTSKSMPVI